MLIVQSAEIAKLQKQITKLQAKLQSFENDGQNVSETPLSTIEQAARDKPPHY